MNPNPASLIYKEVMKVLILGNPTDECIIKGRVKIEIDADGNTKLTASGSGGCKYPDWSSKEEQKFSLKGSKVNFNKKLNVYNIHLKGTETKKVTYINNYETTTKEYVREDSNHSIVIYKDGTIKSLSQNSQYFKLEAKK